MREVIRVECGKKWHKGCASGWLKEHDGYALAPGFDYRLSRGACATAKYDESRCWYDQSRLQIDIQCPAGIECRLGLYIYDWLGFNDRDHEKLVVRLFVAGRDRGEHTGMFPAGKLIELPLGERETSSGTISVAIERVKLGAVLTTLLLAVPTDPGEQSSPQLLSLDEADLDALGERLSAARQRLADIDARLREAEGRSLDVSRQRAARAVVERTIGYGGWALEHGRVLRSARAQYVAQCLEQAELLGASAVSDLDSALSGPGGGGCGPARVSAEDEGSPSAPRGSASLGSASPGRLQIEHGAFTRDGRPVLLSGPSIFCPWQRPLLPWGETLNQFMPFVESCGFNLVELHVGPAQILKSRTESYDIEADVLSTFDCAARNGIVIALSLCIWNNTNQAYRDYPDMRRKEDAHWWMPGCLESTETREYVERFLKDIIPIVRGHPALQSYCLSQEPHVEEFCPSAVERFRQWLRDRYDTVDACNAAWRSNFGSFEEIAPNASSANRILRISENRGLRYDWYTFNQGLAKEFFQWMRGTIREMDPVTPTYLRTLSDVFTEWHCDWVAGIDREALGEVCEIHGTTCAVKHTGAIYALEESGRHSMVHDFLRSLDPRAPVFDGENHLNVDYDPTFLPPEFARTALWLKFLHGVSAQTLWTLTAHGGWEYNLFTQPLAVESLARTTLDARRLSSEIVAFQRARAEVALFFSMSSKLQSAEHLRELRLCYEALRFLDAHVGFATERQVAGGKLSRYRLLVVPAADYVPDNVYRAMIAFLDSGGCLFMAGKSFGFDEHGLERKRPELASSLVWEPGASRGVRIDFTRLSGLGRLYVPQGAYCLEELSDALDSLLADLRVRREVRVTDEAGRRIWAVEARSVTIGEKRGSILVSIVNLGKQERQARITAAAPLGEIRDLIRETRLPGAELELEPLVPLLLELKPAQGRQFAPEEGV